MVEQPPEGFNLDAEAGREMEAAISGIHGRPSQDPAVVAQHLAELEGDDAVSDENGNVPDDHEVMDDDAPSTED